MTSEAPTTLEDRLRRAAEQLHEREHLRVRMQHHDSQIAETRHELARLQARTAAEQRDVEALEGLSVTRVLATVAGERLSDLDRERLEADTARLRAAEAEATLAALQRERASVAVTHDQLAQAPAELAAAVDAKEEWLTEHGAAGGSRLLAIAAERGSADAQLRELAEADQAAEAAVEALSSVEDSLSSASGWSTYDTFFGGGAVSSMVKHNHLDQAQEAAAAADQRLRVLANKVTDVEGMSAALPELELSGGTQFLDVWFDNIFTDWSVRERIQQAQANTARAQAAVQQVQGLLVERRRLVEGRLDSLATEREALLGVGDLPVDRPAPTAAPAAVEADSSPAAQDRPFPPGATLAAIAMTVVAPFVSIVIALVLREREHNPTRRDALRRWAVASAIWLCTGFLLATIIVVSITRSASTGGDCRGGIDRLQRPTYVSVDGDNWTVTRACVDGGSRTRDLPPGKQPFGR